MKRQMLEILCCPQCRGKLVLWSTAATQEVGEGYLLCAACEQVYPVQEGIPHFVRDETLVGLNRRFARYYDLVAPFYRVGLRLGLAPLGGEHRFREETVAGFDIGAGRVLEVSIGPGNNLPYLVALPGIQEIVGLDISLGQLRECRRFASQRGYSVELVHGMAEALPFEEETFDAVLHVGGINFFSDKGQAIREMARVAKPGAMVRILDETERVARWYERALPGFARLFAGTRERITPPIQLVPEPMVAVQLRSAWAGYAYCLEFRTPPREQPAAAEQITANLLSHRL